MYQFYGVSGQGDCSVLGVLLTNLGSPDAPTKQALRPYLKQFLSDPRVVEPPPARWLWRLILNGIILNTRPARSAKAYATVWGSEGSGAPLLDIGRRQVLAVAERVRSQLDVPVVFELGMRYGNPSIASALQRLQAKGCGRILVLPLYPQYAGATTGSTFDAVNLALLNWRWVPEVRTINQYHCHAGYIGALVNSVADFQADNGRPDLLVLSFHGIPQRYCDNGDPYVRQCHETARLVAEGLGLSSREYRVTFQSRFGSEPWVMPYTDESMKALPSQGVKHIQVICPGFSADCLETIEEIGEENKAYFMAAGGERFGYIPCLNDRDDHVDGLADLVLQHLQGWHG